MGVDELVISTNLLRLDRQLCEKRRYVHKMIVTQFRSISMPAGFRRHLVGKILEMFVTLLSLKLALSVG